MCTTVALTLRPNHVPPFATTLDLIHLTPSIGEGGGLRRPLQVKGTGPFRVMFTVIASDWNLGDADVNIQVTATPSPPRRAHSKHGHQASPQDRVPPATDGIRVTVPVLPRQHSIMAGM
jgi:hypothetical protein